MYDAFEGTHTLWVGIRTGGVQEVIEIDNTTLEDLFHSKLSLSNVSRKAFLEGLVEFFELEALPLLTGDVGAVSSLKIFDRRRNQRYMENLMNMERLTKLDSAWSEKDYDEFIRLIGDIETRNLPPSYEKKFELAKKYRQ